MKPKSEFDTIELIRSIVQTDDPRVLVGIGDDAAVCAPSNLPLLLCNDAMVENRHFRLDWISPSDLGHKALAATLSDIAAMNGRPLHAIIALGIRADMPDTFVRDFYTGMQALAASYQVTIVGGDLVSTTNEVFIDVTVVGQTSQPALRSGARPGDRLFVTGYPGLSAAGLAALEADAKQFSEAIESHLRPRPRFDVLPLLNSPGLLTSMIDISDGLSSEIYHLSEKSGCGFELDETAVPIHPEMQRLAMIQNKSALDWAWGGGEDYQLLFTIASDRLKAEPALKTKLASIATEIGQAVEDQTVRVKRNANGKTETLPKAGWNHFLV